MPTPQRSSMVLTQTHVVVGAGAMGLAFVDALLTEDPDATVVLVEERDAPGGHWNDAYPYVTLHQPSAFYGVNSRRLERAVQSAESERYTDLATKSEVLTYYEAVVRRWARSGRLLFLPRCTSAICGGSFASSSSQRCITSLTHPHRVWHLGDDTKVVDATYSRVEIPARSPATDRYAVDPGVELCTPNELPSAAPSKQYVVVGAGKTGVDAVLWLLAHSVPPRCVLWVVSSDPWYLNREMWFPDGALRLLGPLLQAMQRVTSRQEFEAACRDVGLFLTLDPTLPTPTKNKCASITLSDLEALRTVRTLRQGRLRRVTRSTLGFEDGSHCELGADGTLVVDCSANAVPRRPPVPVFARGRITLQPVRVCQQVFSAAAIGYLEGRRELSIEAKNALSTPVPLPATTDDFLDALRGTLVNERAWRRDGAMHQWVRHSRLSFSAHGPSTAATMRWIATNLTQLPRMAWNAWSIRVSLSKL